MILHADRLLSGNEGREWEPPSQTVVRLTQCHLVMRCTVDYECTAIVLALAYATFTFRCQLANLDCVSLHIFAFKLTLTLRQIHYTQQFLPEALTFWSISPLSKQHQKKNCTVTVHLELSELFQCSFALLEIENFSQDCHQTTLLN